MKTDSANRIFERWRRYFLSSLEGVEVLYTEVEAPARVRLAMVHFNEPEQRPLYYYVQLLCQDSSRR